MSDSYESERDAAAECVDAQFKMHGASLDKLKKALDELKERLK